MYISFSVHDDNYSICTLILYEHWWAMKMMKKIMMVMMSGTCVNNDSGDGGGADSVGDIDGDEGEVDKNR